MNFIFVLTSHSIISKLDSDLEKVIFFDTTIILHGVKYVENVIITIIYYYLNCTIYN